MLAGAASHRVFAAPVVKLNTQAGTSCRRLDNQDYPWAETHVAVGHDLEWMLSAGGDAALAFASIF